jgi:toxin YoeB
MKVIFDEEAFAQYLEWQSADKNKFNRINDLIKSIQRDGFMKGIGKPEPLKGRKAYSRRIDEENRLVYIGDNNRDLVILACKGHYED